MNINKRILRPLFSFTQIRHYKRGTPKFWTKDLQKYEQVNYYPRHPDQQDPPVQPTKLLIVQRVKPYKGNPYWHKRVLEDLKLDDSKDNAKIAIVKNTPEICAQLWKIKHLIKVTPMKLPEKLPEDNDSRATWLHENGTLLVTPRVDPAREKATLDFINNPRKLDVETLSHELRMRWLVPYDT